MRKRIDKTEQKLAHLERYYIGMLNVTQPENYRWKSTRNGKTITLIDPDGGICTVTYRKTRWGDAYTLNLYGEEIDVRLPGASFTVYQMLNAKWRMR